MTELAELFLEPPVCLAGNRGRLPELEGDERLAIPWVHEVFGAAPFQAYPVDVSVGITNWLMLGNGPDPTDTTGPNPQQGYGNCAPCTYEHDLMIAIVGGKLLVALPTANGTVTLYFLYTVGQDVGCVIADLLLWLYQHGYIAAFAPVAPGTEDGIMAQFKRGVILGVSLTNTNEGETNNGQPWSAGPGNPPNPRLGHAVLKVKANADGSGTAVSWGLGQIFTPEWNTLCVQERWLILTPDDKLAVGDAAWNALIAALDALPNATGPKPVPVPPAPTPPPVPTPPAPAPPVVPPRPGPPPVPPWTQWHQELEQWFAAVEAWVDSHMKGVSQ